MSIATIDEPDIPAMTRESGIPVWVVLLEPVALLAEKLARTEFVPKGLRGRPEAVAACILWGVEVQIGPMQALDGIDVIDGKPNVSAELMRALVLRAGHEIWAVESSSNAVTMAGRRSGSSQTTTVSWTLADARQAGLLAKENWRKYPRSMLTNRATTELCRLVFPDVLAGLSHDADELSPTAPAAEDVAVQPAPRKRSMRRAKASAEAVEAPPEPEPEPVAPPEPESESEPVAARTDPDAPEPTALRAMFAGMGEQLGRDLNRDQRLAFTAACIGRDVASSLELSAADVEVVLDVLRQIQHGHLAVEWFGGDSGQPVAVFHVPS